MKRRSVIRAGTFAVLMLVAGAPSVLLAVPEFLRIPCEQAARPGETRDEINPRAVVQRADTTWFGDYEVIEGEYHARSGSTKESVMWTFDRGNGPTNDPNRLYNGEGWKALDITANETIYSRIADVTLDLGPGVPSPIIGGAKSLWVGVDSPQSRALCWPCGAGYGNNWCQRAVSEPLAYNGSGSVSLQLKYFNDTEPCYDGTQIYLKRADGTELLLNPYAGMLCSTENPLFVGGFTDAIGSYEAPALYSRTIAPEEIGAAQGIRIVVEFKSDGGYSDEDGRFCTTWGPFGADDVTISGGGIDASYDFENGLGSWTAAVCDAVGTLVDVVDIGCYTILDPCECRLSGNIMEMHDGPCGDDGTHPVGQHVKVESPICDVGGSPANPKRIFMDFDMYAILPQDNGVMIRPGWRYYPWTCPETGAIGWSPRTGQTAYTYFGSDPVCDTWRFGGTEVTSGTPVPTTAEKVIAILELLGDCAALGVGNCSGETNSTPLFDNIAVGSTPFVNAPTIAFEVGGRFQDVGSYPSSSFDPRAPGPANTVYDKYLDSPGRPEVAGDTLVVSGPQPGTDPNRRWEARLWWRVAKRAPLNSDRAGGVETKYKTWRDRVADGKQIDRPYRPEFTYGWMDSVQNGSVALKNKFLSCFREDDDDHVGENVPENEILWDDIFYPGTQIEYFVTANYVSSPNILFYLPDTTGGYFLELEILPGLRVASVPNCGTAGIGYCVYQPATLYIDAYNMGRTQERIENGLRTILNGLPPCAEELGCEIPHQRNWDRYDYLDSSS